MEPLNFKKNFIGHDGFIWWIGQIAPAEVWIKNWETTKDSTNWGQRYKVRIMGYHPYSTAELKDEDLPWAQVLNPPGNSGSLNTAETIRMVEGDVVVGFFLDGSNAQVPMIMGTFANTGQWDKLKEEWKKSGAPPTPFGVFGGYSKVMPEEQYAVNLGNSNEDNGFSKDTNLDTDKKTADGLGQKPLTSTTGQVINLCNTGPVAGIKEDVDDMVGKVMNLKSSLDSGNEFFRDKIKSLVSTTTQNIVRKSGKLTAGVVDDTFNKLIPIGQTGLSILYKGVYGRVLAATKNPAIAHVAGVAAQTAMVGPIGVAENLIGCLANSVTADMGEMVEEILNSVVDNVFNSTDCASDQVVGAITNGIVGKVGNGMSGALGGLQKILSFFGGSGGFNVENLIRMGTSAIAGQVGLSGCNELPRRNKSGPCKYRLGSGPVGSTDLDLQNIMKTANTATALANKARLTDFPLDGIQDIVGALDIFNSDMKLPNFKSELSECYTGLPQVCEPPVVRIFGGGGSDGAAIPLFGNIIGEGRDRTGSIIDLKLTNPGNGYQFPPFVEIADNCDQGYGARARTTIKDGKIDSIYIVSEGENYPVGEQPELAITDIIIVNPGLGYNDGDSLTDNFGNEYDVTVQNGAITKIKPLTTIAVDSVPELSVNSSTGFGAIVFASIDERPEYQGVVKQQIDCIAPRTGNLVGYVKGEPYYGDFHVHPNTGKKMVGAAHTTTPHEVIYDTPQESL